MDGLKVRWTACLDRLDTMLSAAQSDVLKERVTERLKEMNLLVDDELADYVVVLVGNGKGEDEIAQVGTNKKSLRHTLTTLPLRSLWTTNIASVRNTSPFYRASYHVQGLSEHLLVREVW